MTKLAVLKSGTEECRESVIKTLRDALAEAEAGNIENIVIAFVRPGGAINMSRSISNDVGRLAGAVALAQHRLLAEVG